MVMHKCTQVLVQACGHVGMPIQIYRKQACTGVLGSSALAPHSGEMPSALGSQPSKLLRQVGTGALLFRWPSPAECRQ